MGRKHISGLCTGTGGQMCFENFELELVLKKQRINSVIAVSQEEKKIDFYVGPGGKVLSANHSKWIGKSQRDKYLKQAKNKALRNAINQLYRPGAFIGDGGTSSVYLFEKRTGLNLGKNGGNHKRKVQEMIRHFEKKILTQKMSQSDKKLAGKILNKLKKVMVR